MDNTNTYYWIEVNNESGELVAIANNPKDVAQLLISSNVITFNEWLTERLTPEDCLMLEYKDVYDMFFNTIVQQVVLGNFYEVTVVQPYYYVNTIGVPQLWDDYSLQDKLAEEGICNYTWFVQNVCDTPWETNARLELDYTDFVQAKVAKGEIPGVVNAYKWCEQQLQNTTYKRIAGKLNAAKFS